MDVTNAKRYMGSQIGAYIPGDDSPTHIKAMKRVAIIAEGIDLAGNDKSPVEAVIVFAMTPDQCRKLAAGLLKAADDVAGGIEATPV